MIFLLSEKTFSFSNIAFRVSWEFLDEFTKIIFGLCISLEVIVALSQHEYVNYTIEFIDLEKFLETIYRLCIFADVELGQCFIFE